MQIKSVLLFLLLPAAGQIVATPAAPPDTALLIARVDQQLTKGEKWISAILTDTALAFLHPLTPFRQVIKKHAKAEKIHLAAPSEPGTPTRIEAYVLDPNGDPVPGALVYVYQTDDRGWYATTGTHVPGQEGDRRHARLFGYLKTDQNGYFTLETILPQSYPNSELPRHIHCEVFSGDKVLITELLFKDDPKLTPEVAFNARRDGYEIAPNLGIAKRPQYSYRLTLR